MEDDKSINYVMSTLDNEVVDEIDIGQEDWQHHWPKDKKYFSWKFIDHTPDMSAKQQLIMAQTAYNSFEQICDLKLDYRPELNIVDSTVEWLESLDPFGGKSNVLAHAFLYYPGSTHNGIIEFNDSELSRHMFTPLGWPLEAYLVDSRYKKGEIDSFTGELKMLSTQPVLQILMHELGHTLLGRHDIINRDSLMYPYVHPGYKNGILQPEVFYWDNITSIPRAQKLFGKPSKWSWNRLNRWRHRRTIRSIYERK